MKIDERLNALAGQWRDAGVSVPKSAGKSPLASPRAGTLESAAASPSAPRATQALDCSTLVVTEHAERGWTAEEYARRERTLWRNSRTLHQTWLGDDTWQLRPRLEQKIQEDVEEEVARIERGDRSTRLRQFLAAREAARVKLA